LSTIVYQIRLEFENVVDFLWSRKTEEERKKERDLPGWKIYSE